MAEIEPAKARTLYERGPDKSTAAPVGMTGNEG